MSFKINDFKIEFNSFPAGERSIIIPEEFNYMTHMHVETSIYNSSDIIDLMLGIHTLRINNPNVKIDLKILYFPYSRNDRIFTAGESFGIKFFSELINNLKFNKVITYDLHSDVSRALINNLKEISCDDIFKEHDLYHYFNTTYDIISPDQGALKKIHKIWKHFDDNGFLINLFPFQKIREEKNGNIQLYSLISQETIKNKNFLIIDDICDGGSTFINIAKLLKENGARSLKLYITHGLFTKGLLELKEYYDEIICFHTKEKISNLEKIKILNKENK